MKLRILISIFLTTIFTTAMGQKGEFKDAIDSLNTYLKGYSIKNYRPHFAMKVDSVQWSTDSTHFVVYVNEAITGQAPTETSLKAWVNNVTQHLPQSLKIRPIQWVDKFGRDIGEYIPNYARTQQKDSARLWTGQEYSGAPWVKRVGVMNKILHGGLNARHLMINASHGRYFNTKEWLWQRPYLFCTTEDLLTQSFIYPYLIPILERSGAVVYSVRERDPQPKMWVVDAEGGPAITKYGSYSENESSSQIHWTTAADNIKGFAMPQLPIRDKSNPFIKGKVRQIATTQDTAATATAIWTPALDTAGRYAVYVSYATTPSSVDDAHYVVRHKGAETHYLVNQRMGGGTWVYLGTFDFDAQRPKENCVILSNVSNKPGVITADAVRWGGGMGLHSRGKAGTSGMPRFFEGSTYNALWSGIPHKTFDMEKPSNDYNEEIRSRGAAANHLAGGSIYIPDSTGLRVPLEMVMGIHSDAGAKDAKVIIGTLGICTTVKPDGTNTLPSGMSRRASIDLSTAVVTNITQSLEKEWCSSWTRREVWDRNYGECRTPHVPSMILEMFSHQNYTDFTYVHDPTFKASMARAIYKGILQFISHQHGEDSYTIQPLPIHRFSATLSNDAKNAHLSWLPTQDTLSTGAAPTGYIIYTRVENGDFDEGTYVEEQTHVTIPIQQGKRYDFKVTAVNAGGESADSEILSVYSALNAQRRVLIVNGFTRLSGPARIETSDKLGFDLDKDFGVPDRYTAAYAGRQLCFDRKKYGREKEGALGFCGNELEGKIIGGNTFDYPTLHGKAIAASGNYSYESTSREAWVGGDVDMSGIDVVDYIVGAECDAPHNMRPYKALDAKVRTALSDFLSNGGGLLLSGCYIGSDAKTKEEQDFIRHTLKFEHAGTARNDSTGMVNGLGLAIEVHRGLTADFYPIQSPDIIVPTDTLAFPAFSYYGGGSAGIAYPGTDYRIVAMGFPFESIKGDRTRAQAIDAIIRFLTEQ